MVHDADRDDCSPASLRIARSMPDSYERAYRALEEQIVTMELPPARVLNEAALAEAMRLPAGAIHAALRRLAREGLVAPVGKGEVAISEIDAQMAASLIEVRRRLEPLTAALAAERASPDQRARFRALEQSFRMAVRHGEARIFLWLDRAFHELLREAAGNPFCCSMMGQIDGLARRFFFQSRLAMSVPVTAALHADIAASVARGDPARAEAAVLALLEYNDRFAEPQRRRA